MECRRNGREKIKKKGKKGKLTIGKKKRRRKLIGG